MIKHLTLGQKIWIIISLAIISTIIFSYLLSNYFYQKYYVENLRKTLEEEGSRLATNYTGGDITPRFMDQIHWFNLMFEPEVLLVTDPQELGVRFPFDHDYESYVNEAEREQLLNGEIVSIIGYESKIGHQIMGVLVPLLDGNRLKGILYLYSPLAKVTEMISDITSIWITFAILYILFLIIIGRIVITKLTRPLQKLENATFHMSQGNYLERVKVTTNDEIGKLGHAFNNMAIAIAEEDDRKKDFLANVSHELRTPLSYVKGYSEAIIDRVVKSSEDEQKYIKLIHREASRMQRLVQDLLDLSKLEKNAYPLSKQPLVFAQLIEESIAIYEPILLEKEITLNTSIDPEIIIDADEDRIEQIIHNIMDNAVNYTLSGGKISVELHQQGNNQCELVITDTGIGISEEHLSHLGERFYRINKARTRKDGGTGLGIAIVKQIVAAHEGSISFASKEGKGTQVHITLPIMEN
ncbi:sensor histidine kinase [Chengkuizengella sediminis]|uniref:sensor histidine kinase n=1 Tax=Chengkuizengella sediminis TaxID=1885917 RepID=UPI00138A2AD5|nr:HAMP domain-containing sensor histidine kinase [Chengkuizengella sediminis]NDI36878.1 HAMP domain-containing protein [Chengkuizengella sediminis]